jgi:tetratricopeptide (TPR) repeat protein
MELGGAYLGYGMPDKAQAMISAAIAKGGLSHPDEAYILLGIAYERLKNNAEAIKAFNKATTDPQYARLAKLWALEART